MANQTKALLSIVSILFVSANSFGEGGETPPYRDRCGTQYTYFCGGAVAEYFKRNYAPPSGYRLKAVIDKTDYNQVNFGINLRFSLISVDGKKVCGGGSAISETLKSITACSMSDTKPALDSACLTGISNNAFEVTLPETCGVPL